MSAVKCDLYTCDSHPIPSPFFAAAQIDEIPKSPFSMVVSSETPDVFLKKNIFV